MVYRLPLVLVVLFPTTFLLTYTIAVLLGHTEADFPYISDTGTHSPESCIFGELLTISAGLLFFTFYMRFRQVKACLRNTDFTSKYYMINKCGLTAGLLSTLGLTLVANFQETNVRSVHLTGAFMTFGFGTIYCWLQTYLSFFLCPAYHSRTTAWLRLGLSCATTVFFISSILFGTLARKYFNGDDPTKWYPVDGGWVFHVTSTASEWFSAISFNLFLLTFVPEFRKVKVYGPQVHIITYESTSIMYENLEENLVHA